MAKQAYSSKEMERFFEPRRVRVLAEDYGVSVWVHSHQDRRYHLVIQNMLTGEIVAEWKRTSLRKFGRPGYWSDQPPNPVPPKGTWTSDTFDSKQDAINEAKVEAKERGLAFSLTTDVAPYQEVKEGPVRECLVCKTLRRSREPFVCEECRHLVEVGRDAWQGQVEGVVEQRDLLPVGVPGYYEVGVKLGELLAKLAGSEIGESWDHYSSEVKPAFFIKGAQRRSGDRWRYLIKLTPGQAGTFQEIVKLLEQLLPATFEAGRKQGENLILGLANGEYTIDQFQDRLAREKE